MEKPNPVNASSTQSTEGREGCYDSGVFEPAGENRPYQRLGQDNGQKGMGKNPNGQTNRVCRAFNQVPKTKGTEGARPRDQNPVGRCAVRSKLR